jgi:hypothetical protein
MVQAEVQRIKEDNQVQSPLPDYTGKGMWIIISPGYKGLDAANFWNEHNRKAAELNGGKIDIPPYVTMKSADNKIICGWLASQTDMLAEDWMIVD